MDPVLLHPGEFSRRVTRRSRALRLAATGVAVAVAAVFTALTALAGAPFLVFAVVGLVPAAGVLWWTWQVAPGPFEPRGSDWTIAAGETVDISDGRFSTRIPWREIRQAHRVDWSQWDQTGDLEGQLWLHLHDGPSVRISDRAKGFDAAWQRIRNRVPSTSASIDV